jgi:hypothetical protein
MIQMWCAIGQTNSGDLYIFAKVRANSLEELTKTTPEELIAIEGKNAQVIYNPKREKVNIDNVNSPAKISLCGYDFYPDGFRLIESKDMPDDFLIQIKARLGCTCTNIKIEAAIVQGTQ